MEGLDLILQELPPEIEELSSIEGQLFVFKLDNLFNTSNDPICNMEMLLLTLFLARDGRNDVVLWTEQPKRNTGKWLSAVDIDWGAFKIFDRKDTAELIERKMRGPGALCSNDPLWGILERRENQGKVEIGLSEEIHPGARWKSRRKLALKDFPAFMDFFPGRNPIFVNPRPIAERICLTTGLISQEFIVKSHVSESRGMMRVIAAKIAAILSEK